NLLHNKVRRNSVHHNWVHHNTARSQERRYNTLRTPLHRARRRSKPTRTVAISFWFLSHALRKLFLYPQNQRYLSSYIHYTHHAQLLRACLYRNSISASQKNASPRSDYTTPWSSIASATFTKPVMFAPTTRLPGCPYSAAVSHAFLKIVDMMWRKRESTSSHGHGKRIEFWLISSPDVATPPALAALPGPKR